ncbi:MAG: histidinol-phosphate transaminase [Dehalococcoidales bacterium]|nr:histidinol-phosphate transaminase [Dehalococcoidales bacterium]
MPSGSSPDINKIVRPDLVALGGYSAHKAPDTVNIAPERIIKLDANENPYGCSPKVQKALAGYTRWNTYPDAGQTKLRQQLQAYTGVDAEYIVAANGSGELLDYILGLLLQPGDEVINCPPTFDLYRVRTLINRGKLVNVPRTGQFAVNIEAVKAAVSPRTKLIVLSNPNNPSGNCTPEKDLLSLVDTGVPVLVDEAYYEFCGETLAPLIGKYKNLMVLRTYSKWCALAGLRIGYGLFPAEIAGYLMKIKLPYNVNLAAQIAVQETLKDTDYLMGNVSAIIAERQRLSGELKGLGWLKPYPSRANFILCALLKGDALDVQQKLLERGILVRYFDQPQVKNCLRISVGKPEHTDALIKALREIGPGDKSP